MKEIKNFFKLLSLLILPVTLVLILNNSIDQVLSKEIEKMLRNPAGTSPFVWAIGILSFIFGVLFTSLNLIIVISALKNNFELKDLPRYIKTYFNQLLIEYCRSLGRIISWGLLFIIPALFQYLVLFFVPFIVIHNNDYDLGKVDALDYSKKIFLKKWGSTTLLILIFLIALPLAVSSLFDEYKIIWKTPIPSLLLTSFDGFLIILSTYLFYKIYNKSSQLISS